MEQRNNEQAEAEKFLSRRIIVKVGSNVLTEGATKEEPLNLATIDDVARQCSELFRSGVEVYLVSSGSVASGRNLLDKNDDDIKDKQVEAVYGQPQLMFAWIGAFKKYGVNCGQILLTENDLPNAAEIIRRSAKEGVVIINENDAVSDEEMKQFVISADNDRLAAFVASRVEAETLVLLTDVQGILDKEGKLIESGDDVDVAFLNDNGGKGRGGMFSKAYVAKLSQHSGMNAFIGSAKVRDIILRIAREDVRGLCTSFIGKEDFQGGSN